MPQPSIHPLLAGLNARQREAVERTDGPVMVLAGAGSGKTRVLSHRVAYLIATNKAPAWNILAVTFTNKAANEMRERIVSLVGPAAKRIWIGTFHSVCARMLRECPEAANVPVGFVVYDDSDQMTVVKECMKRLQVDEARFQARALLSGISKLKEKLADPAEAARSAGGAMDRVVASVYKCYEAKLRENGALDFDDLLVRTVQMLQTSREAAEKFQERFRYVLVDEYQDVNYPQYLLVRLIAARHHNLCVVGDDDQSIYGFRGANVDLMLRFDRDFPNAHMVKLEQNYRSTQKILEAAHAVVARNPERKDKRLWTENADGAPITVWEAGTEQDEALFVLHKIRELVRTRQRRWSDFAILYRTNAQSRAFEEAFMRFATPYIIVGGLRFYERKEIKDVVAYLRVAHNPRDAVSLKRIINVPARAIGQSTLSVLEAAAEESQRPLWDVISDLGVTGLLPTRARTAVRAFAALIAGLRAEEAGTVTQLTESILDASGYMAMLQADRDPAAITRVENVKEFLSVTADYDTTYADPSPAGFLEQVSLVSDIDSLTSDSEAVTLMTLHSAKGLEFPVVFLVGAEDGVLPHTRSMQSERDMAEERRLCYVGITRAREELIVTHAYRRTLFGVTSNFPPSRFLRDIPATALDPGRERSTTERRSAPPAAHITSTPQPRRTETPPQPPGDGGAARLRVGQKVSHATFGVGVILSAKEQGADVMVSVAFPEHGIKRLMAGIAKLTPV